MNEEARPVSGRRPETPRAENLADGMLAVVHWLTLVLALCVTLTVIAGGVCLFRLVPSEGIPGTLDKFYPMFEDVLSALLLLVVGLELVVMLVLRRPESLVEIMFFVIARKVLIKTDHVYELLIAVVAIAALFAVKKHLMPDDGAAPKPRRDV